MRKNIDTEINRLNKIKEEMNHISKLRQDNPLWIFTTQDRYDILSNNMEINPELIYYIVPDEVWKYLGWC